MPELIYHLPKILASPKSTIPRQGSTFPDLKSAIPGQGYSYSGGLKSTIFWTNIRWSFRGPIMGGILVAKNPVLDSALDTLLSLDHPSCLTISWLGCLLKWQAGHPVCFLHPSFFNFLSHRFWCGSDKWYINTKLHNHHLFTSCINHLNNALARNICNLMLGLAPVTNNLPEALSYAARSWISHTCMMACADDGIARVLEVFLFWHLLHWLEAMSILKQSRMTIASMQQLFEWLQVRAFAATMSYWLMDLNDRHTSLVNTNSRHLWMMHFISSRRFQAQ